MNKDDLKERLLMISSRVDSFAILLENEYMNGFLKIDSAKTGYKEIKADLDRLIKDQRGGA